MTAPLRHALNADEAAEPHAPRRRPLLLRRLYGDSPLHLLALLACLAVSLYAVTRVGNGAVLTRIAVWFLGAAIAWDFLAGPLLALVDRLLQPLRRAGLLNTVRLPAALSLLLFVVWAPAILQRSERVFRNKSGLGQDAFLGRWVAITAVLFALSFAVWGVSRLRAGRRA